MAQEQIRPQSSGGGDDAQPDDGFTESTDSQAIVLGRLNRLYGTVGGAPLASGYRGRVGFITD